MPEPIHGLLLIALVATAILFWLRVQEQVHERRLRSRLDEVRHVSALVRASLAQQRS